MNAKILCHGVIVNCQVSVPAPIEIGSPLGASYWQYPDRHAADVDVPQHLSFSADIYQIEYRERVHQMRVTDARGGRLGGRWIE
jgi:hypothetical protein